MESYARCVALFLCSSIPPGISDWRRRAQPRQQCFRAFVYAVGEKTECGVFVVMMWTDGAFNIKQMFPATGDAPRRRLSRPATPGGQQAVAGGMRGGASAGAEQLRILEGERGRSRCALPSSTSTARS
jgi:hypothetical protein